MYRKNVAKARQHLELLYKGLDSIFDFGSHLEKATPYIQQFYEFQRKLEKLVFEKAKALYHKDSQFNYKNSFRFSLGQDLLQAAWVSSKETFCSMHSNETTLEREWFPSGPGYKIRIFAILEILLHPCDSFIHKSQRYCSPGESYWSLFRSVGVGKEGSVICSFLKEHDLYDKLPDASKTVPYFMPDDGFDLCDFLVYDDFEPVDIIGRTRLHRALESHKRPAGLYISKYKVRNLELTREGTVNVFDILGRTALHIACQTDNHEIVQSLLEGGANVTSKAVQGLQPLHFAAAAGALAVCRILINTPGINLTALDKKEQTPLDYALLNENFEVARLLASTIGDKATMTTDTFYPAMVAALNDKSPHIVGDRLLWTGGDPNMLTYDFMHGVLSIRNVLTEALLRSQYETADRLLERGAKIDAHIHEQGTALHVCTRLKDTEAVRWLLHRRADPLTRDAKGRTALMLACRKGYCWIVKLLLKCSRRLKLLKAVDYSGKTAFDHATAKGNTNCRMLICSEEESSEEESSGEESLGEGMSE